MNKYPDHEKEVIALKRIEGQIRGVQKMIEGREYCIDILNQMQAAIRALEGVQKTILERHMKSCVAKALLGKDTTEKDEKIREVMELIGKFRKG